MYLDFRNSTFIDVFFNTLSSYNSSIGAKSIEDTRQQRNSLRAVCSSQDVGTHKLPQKRGKTLYTGTEPAKNQIDIISGVHKVKKLL